MRYLVRELLQEVEKALVELPYSFVNLSFHDSKLFEVNTIGKVHTSVNTVSSGRVDKGAERGRGYRCLLRRAATEVCSALMVRQLGGDSRAFSDLASCQKVNCGPTLDLGAYVEGTIHSLRGVLQ
jgi:hypothetical protein